MEHGGDDPAGCSRVFWRKYQNQKQQREIREKLYPGIKPQIVGPASLQETRKGNRKQAQVRFRENGSALPAPETKSSVIRLQGVTILTGSFEKDQEQTPIGFCSLRTTIATGNYYGPVRSLASIAHQAQHHHEQIDEVEV
jgi:hypothetical protein